MPDTAATVAQRSLSSARLALSPLDLERDVPDLHEAFADPSVMDPWLDEETSSDPARTRERLAARAALPGARIWTIRRRGEDTALGLVELLGGTAIPALTWMLRRSAWRQGIMSEAAATVVDFLFDNGADLVEVWADATNTGSIRVAQHCGCTVRARFATRGRDGAAKEKVVLGRYRDLRPQRFFHAYPVLPVRDVAATLELLDAIGFTPGFRIGEPPEPLRYAEATVEPWTGTSAIRLRRVARGRIAPATVAVTCGVPVAEVHRAVLAAGGQVEGPPAPLPWGDVAFVCVLPEGHRLEISGPK